MSRPHPCLAWLLGWLFPGAGHFYAGRRAQGAVFAATLAGCFAAGVLLGRGRAVGEDRPEYLVLQLGAGLPAAAAWAISRAVPPDVTVAARETATIYTLVPALLNLVVALDAAARAARSRKAKEEGPEVAATPAPAPAPAPEAPAAPEGEAKP